MREQYFSLLGYPCDPYCGGYHWQGEAPSQAVISAVEALPQDQGTFIITNLETSEVGQVLAATIPAEGFFALKSFQCALIRALRSAAYQAESDGIFFNHEAEGQSRETWLSVRVQIKSRYPWPGDYR